MQGRWAIAVLVPHLVGDGHKLIIIAVVLECFYPNASPLRWTRAALPIELPADGCEIGHALGFFDSFRIDESTGEAEYGLGDDNIPTIFDYRIFDTESNRLIDEDECTNPSTELTDAVTGITLFWLGRKTLTANGGSYPVLLWAPEEYDSGSSVAHLASMPIPRER